MEKEKPSHPFPVGTKVEVRTDAEGFIGSWYEAVVTDHLTAELNRVVYRVKYLTLLRDDEPDLPEIDELDAENVRPVAPSSVEVAREEEISDPKFQMHELVEAYHEEGWWYGVISGLRNPVTGKYRVSFPLSREVIDFYPSQIRPQMDYIKGAWILREPKQQKNSYKTGAKVEAIKICEKYGRSWFPAKVQKIIPDDNFLIKYENEKYLPYGHLAEIVDFSSLRPVLDRNPKSNKIELNSDVEVFNEGAWINGVVTSVRSNGSYLIRVCENDDVTPLLVNGDCIRLIRNMGKRRRLDGEERSSSAKNNKNDDSVSESDDTNVLLSALKKNKTEKSDTSISPSGETCELVLKKHSISPNKKENYLYYKITKKTVNMEIAEDKLMEPTAESINSPVDVVADISKDKMVNLQNGSNEQTSNLIPTPLNPSSSYPLNPNQVSSLQNPNPNQISTLPNPNPNQVLTPPNSNHNQVSTLPSPSPNPNQISFPLNPNPSESTPFTPPFESCCPIWIWNTVQSLNVFKKTPQKPHFTNLKRFYEKEELEGRALGQMITYYNISYSINTLSLETDFSEFNTKLRILDSLEQDGFEIDPLRTSLNEMIESKKAIFDVGLKIKEKECEVNRKHENYKVIYEYVYKISVDYQERREKIRELEEREREVKERRERELEKSERNKERILDLKSEISRLNKNVERAKEEFLAAMKVPLWKD